MSAAGAHTAQGRIARRFAAARGAGRPAFVAYFTVGYPSLADSARVAERLVEEGADALEIGVPCANPFADGAVLRTAAAEAVRQGVGLQDALTLAHDLRIRHKDFPLVLFLYAETAVEHGEGRLASDASAAGVDAVLCVGMPEGGNGDLRSALRTHGVGYIPLITPDMAPEAAAAASADAGDAFAYVITSKGPTGVRREMPHDLGERLDAICDAVALPVVAGFGIASRRQGVEIAHGHADGFVIGSAITERIRNGGLDSMEPLA